VRVSALTGVVMVVTALVPLPLLLTTSHDESYSCRSGALVDVLHPEPEMGADFRRDVAFDSGYTCNRTARRQVAAAGIVVLLAATSVYVAHRRRRLHGAEPLAV
jgi:hypothetical protein